MNWQAGSSFTVNEKPARIKGRFRYWLDGDLIPKDGATIQITASSPPDDGTV